MIAGAFGLYRIEVRRMLARRIVRVLAALVVLGILLASIIVFVKSHRGPVATPVVDRTQIEACARGDFGPPLSVLPPGPRRERQCAADLAIPVRDPRFALEKIPGIARGVIVPLVLLTMVFGASFIGGEWRAGTMTTALTWEPRRVRLLVAKALAAVTVGMAFAIVAQILLSLGLTPAAALRGTTHGGAVLGPLVQAVLRGALLAGVGSAIGFSIGAIGRNTAAALGVAFVYLAILEGPLLGNFFPGMRRWLVVGNSIVFVNGKETFAIAGRSPAAAGVILATYGIASIAIATAVFRARDVA